MEDICKIDSSGAYLKRLKGRKYLSIQNTSNNQSGMLREEIISQSPSRSHRERRKPQPVKVSEFEILLVFMKEHSFSSVVLLNSQIGTNFEQLRSKETVKYAWVDVVEEIFSVENFQLQWVVKILFPMLVTNFEQSVSYKKVYDLKRTIDLSSLNYLTRSFS